MLSSLKETYDLHKLQLQVLGIQLLEFPRGIWTSRLQSRHRKGSKLQSKEDETNMGRIIQALGNWRQEREEQ